MQYIEPILFLLLAGTAIFFFARSVKMVRRNIFLGKSKKINDNPAQRWATMARVALGQSKMVVKPIAAFFHIIIYVGFLIINIELLEIFVDGVTGGHRTFMKPLGAFYPFIIGFIEVVALLVLIAALAFLYRRYVLKLERFQKKELFGWPSRDAATILVWELVLVFCIFLMNAADTKLQAYNMPVSGLLNKALAGLSPDTLHILERIGWWGHIIGVLGYLNYVPFSKHFHIILAFPNTWYSNLQPKGEFTNMDSVTTEVKLMLGLQNETPEGYQPPTRFGAKEVTDLNWKNLLDAYTCTECGRCTAECPANNTGKLLSPRKIMMDTRDRMEEMGRNIDANKGTFVDDGKKLVGDYITTEELWACTSCNACVQACPVNINPLEIIVELRRGLVMEDAQMPQSLGMALSNIQNNGAPWQFSPADRFNWANE